MKNIQNFFYYLILCMLVVMQFFSKTAHANKPLNVLFYVFMFPEATQGFILNQMVGFLKKGHKVTILTRSTQGYTSLYPSKVATHQEHIFHNDIKTYNLLRNTYYQKLPATFKNFDIILCQFGNLLPSFLEYQKKHNITGKLVVCFRGWDITAHLNNTNTHDYIAMLKKVDLCLPVCEVFKKNLITLGYPAEKIAIVHSAIDCKRFRFYPRRFPNTKTIKILAINRLVEKKGTEYAIKAVAQLLIKYPHLEFTIVGGGPLESKLRSLIKKLHAENNIKLIGWRNQEEVITLLQQADIFVLPSITAGNNDQEGIPNALKEAMAIGLPVVSTYHSGIPELVKDGISGFLVPERDVLALTSKLEYLINNPNQRVKMGIEGRLFVENFFNRDKENEKLIQLCEKLIRQ